MGVLTTARSVQEAIEKELKATPADRERKFVVRYADGTETDGHHVNWGNVRLHDIQVLGLHFGEAVYVLNRDLLPGFVEFVYFNTAVRGIRRGETVQSRSIGWHNGKREFIIRISEATGRQMLDTNDNPITYAGVYYSHTESPPRHLHPYQSKMLLGAKG